MAVLATIRNTSIVMLGFRDGWTLPTSIHDSFISIMFGAVNSATKWTGSIGMLTGNC